MNSEQILRRIGEIGIVPVIRAKSVKESLLAVQAIYAGGIPIVEITMTVPDAIHVINSVVERYGDEVLIGAGTVTTAHDARKCIDAGAQFLVSPGLSPSVLKAAAQQRILAIPGAFTPTEVMNGLAEGARVIKIFPCSSGGGPQHLKALHGPFPDVALIPTGGVNASNAAQYIMAGAFALGAGGELIDSNSLKNGDLSETTSAAKRLTAAVAAARAVKHNPVLSNNVPQTAL